MRPILADCGLVAGVAIEIYAAWRLNHTLALGVLGLVLILGALLMEGGKHGAN